MESIYSKNYFVYPIKKLHCFLLFLADGGWREEKRKFCRNCVNTFDTIEDAKSACEKDYECNAVYDLFCDDVGRFCTCRFNNVVEQTHPRAIDSIYKKEK